MATEKRQLFAGGANYVWMTYIKIWQALRPAMKFVEWVEKL
jgi:hypothetical protein